MRALAVVYERDAGPGVWEQEAESAGAQLDWWVASEGRLPRHGSPSATTR